ncbi:MAG: hypothetical protein JNL82_16175 [Myxococcales bacterium]|nr:hypothetical protein [Myxococcales bacterium]
MADEQSNTPESYINDIEAGVEKKFTAQLEDMRRQVRDARDKADAERICGQKATAEMTARMAEYRRGRWYDVGAVVGSAVVGFTVGYDAQKFADWRPFGFPAAAVAGVPGVAAGALLDESVVTRSVFAVGGAMYILGATTYVLTHPQTEQP